MPKIFEYFKQTAMVNPYANLTFVDPKGRLYKFIRGTTDMPTTEGNHPHPYGVDVELLQRLIQITHLQEHARFSEESFSPSRGHNGSEVSGIQQSESTKNPKRLGHEEIVRLMQNLKKFPDFLPPDASCLSPAW